MQSKYIFIFKCIHIVLVYMKYIIYTACNELDHLLTLIVINNMTYCYFKFRRKKTYSRITEPWIKY